MQSKSSKKSELLMENVVRTEGWAGAPEITNRSKERSKGMEFLKGTIFCNCGDKEKMEEIVVQTQCSLHCILGLGIHFDHESRGTTFL
jgi:hypothetical protein